MTVASFATIITSRPLTEPTPVTTPPDGTASSPYRSWPASGESSRKGEPGSRRASTRCRASILPRAVCSARARGPPPSCATAVAERTSISCSSIRAAFARKEALEVSTAPSSTDAAAARALSSLLPAARTTVERSVFMTLERGLRRTVAMGNPVGEGDPLLSLGAWAARAVRSVCGAARGALSPPGRRGSQAVHHCVTITSEGGQSIASTRLCTQSMVRECLGSVSGVAVVRRSPIHSSATPLPCALRGQVRAGSVHSGGDIARARERRAVAPSNRTTRRCAWY